MNPGSVRCKICNMSFMGFQYIQPHIIQSHTPIFCLNCDKQFTSLRNFDDHHYGLNEHAIRCGCGLEFHGSTTIRNAKNFELHGAAEHCLSCTHCDLLFDDRVSHGKHVETDAKHLKIIDNIRVREEQKKEKIARAKAAAQKAIWDRQDAFKAQEAKWEKPPQKESEKDIDWTKWHDASLPARPQPIKTQPSQTQENVSAKVPSRMEGFRGKYEIQSYRRLKTYTRTFEDDDEGFCSPYLAKGELLRKLNAAEKIAEYHEVIKKDKVFRKTSRNRGILPIPDVAKNEVELGEEEEVETPQDAMKASLVKDGFDIPVGSDHKSLEKFDAMVVCEANEENVSETRTHTKLPEYEDETYYKRLSEQVLASLPPDTDEIPVKLDKISPVNQPQANVKPERLSDIIMFLNAAISALDPLKRSNPEAGDVLLGMVAMAEQAMDPDVVFAITKFVERANERVIQHENENTSWLLKKLEEGKRALGGVCRAQVAYEVGINSTKIQKQWRDKVSDEVTELQKKIVEYEQKIDVLERRIEVNNSTHQERIKLYEEDQRVRIERLEEAKTGSPFKAEIEELKQRVKYMEEENREALGWRERYHRVNRERDMLQKLLNTGDSKRMDLEKELAKATEELNVTRKPAELLKYSQAEAVSLKQKSTSLAKTLTETQRSSKYEIEQLQAQVSALHQEKADLASQLERKSSKVKKMESEQTKSSNALHKRNLQSEILKKHADSLECDNKKYQNTIAAQRQHLKQALGETDSAKSTSSLTPPRSSSTSPKDGVKGVQDSSASGNKSMT